jgi:quercetin dioxygenase-like cupin family protein
VIWFEPDEKHWRAASPAAAMAHIAFAEAHDDMTASRSSAFRHRH